MMDDFTILLKHRSAAYRAMNDAYAPLYKLKVGGAAYRKAEQHLATCEAVHDALDAVVREILPDDEPADDVSRLTEQDGEVLASSVTNDAGASTD